jgi:hypothetical protein
MKSHVKPKLIVAANRVHTKAGEWKIHPEKLSLACGESRLQNLADGALGFLTAELSIYECNFVWKMLEVKVAAILYLNFFP